MPWKTNWRKLLKEYDRWLSDLGWDVLYSYSRHSVTCNAQSICRNSQFNTKDSYITATDAIQTKKARSMKFIIPFQVFTEECSKAGLTQRNEFYHSVLSQGGFQFVSERI